MIHLSRTTHPTQVLRMLGQVINVWVIVSNLGLHLGHKMEHGIPHLLSSLLTGREL